MFRRTLTIGGWMAAAATLFALATPAVAQDFPARPVKFVVSWSPGGGADSLARHLAKGLTERWNQPVIVENKPGADATIGIQSMLQQPADGHTIGLIITSHAVHSSLRKAMPYDLLKDFVGVTNVVEAPNLLVVNPKLNVKSVEELIALGKTRPLNFAAPGLGGPGHLGGVMFNTATGLNALHVPYPGGAPALTSVLRGDADFMFTTLLSGLPLAKSGQVRAIAITSKTRSALYPELPTMAEAGLKNFELVTWYAIVAKGGTPKAVVDKLAADINAVAKDPKLAAQFEKDGVHVIASGADRFGPYLSAEVRKWADVVKAGNIQPQ
ncbi:tripartite tricarboxylate transporter substrate-binding protein [Ramlibacter sp.]|uniref:tripartite tricarboxylate transporter substrate-binding protein n=1 Tax=Ramlibacter sp. TaxID=1917967 RepID=UPI003D097104